jgi:hypothetical protein
MNIYDVVIIGAGISGLYSAYKIQNINPNIKLLILEEQGEKYMGGRTGNDIFEGVKIVTGADVGRIGKDKALLHLLHTFNIKYKIKYSTPDYYNFTPLDICKVMKKLKREFIHYKNKEYDTFEIFAKNILGVNVYNLFVVTAGYSDFEKSDIHDVLFDYEMDDNIHLDFLQVIEWDKLIKKLVDSINMKNIHFSTKIIKVTMNPSNYGCVSENGEIFYGNKVIISTTINGVKYLLPKITQLDIYNKIHSQPFLRLYGKFSKESNILIKQIVKKYTIIPGPLQKMIPVDSTNGIYMIAYCDNENAVYLKPYLKNVETNRAILCNIIENVLNLPSNSLKLIKIKGYYWKTGTHYYEPIGNTFKNRKTFINTAQHPHKNMLIVGEVISRQQGWVEGALESVDTVIDRKWVNY